MTEQSTPPCHTCGSAGRTMDSDNLINLPASYTCCSNAQCWFYNRWLPSSIWNKRIEQPLFTVNAGKYDQYYAEPGQQFGENIKYSSEPLTLDNAIARALELHSSNTQDFCHIDYKGIRLLIDTSHQEAPHD